MNDNKRKLYERQPSVHQRNYNGINMKKLEKLKESQGSNMNDKR